VIRSNYYEVAFEAYLRQRRVGYVAVDESRRTQLGDVGVKSFDFIVVGPKSARLAVDVKGRKFPGGSTERPVCSWQNWVAAEDVDGLGRWASHLGEGFRGVLAFVYHIRRGYGLPPETPDLFVHQGRLFLIRAVEVSEYRNLMRPRSKRWETVHLPSAGFQRVVKPFAAFLDQGH